MFSIEELRKLQTLVRVYRRTQEIEGLRVMAASFHAIESRLMLAESKALASCSNFGYPDLDSQAFLMLSRAASRSGAELSSKIRRAIFEQSRLESFSNCAVQ